MSTLEPNQEEPREKIQLECEVGTSGQLPADNVLKNESTIFPRVDQAVLKEQAEL